MTLGQLQAIFTTAYARKSEGGTEAECIHAGIRAIVRALRDHISDMQHMTDAVVSEAYVDGAALLDEILGDEPGPEKAAREEMK
jgi:hypothetical protein